ncbi:MAG: ATP-binding protein [Deltaproteobacteria bacterium]|nr:ATP-binding protein [Deltaproteobacteria bacterium]
MLFRIIIVSLLLVATLMRHIREFEFIVKLNSSFIVLIIISAYLASLVYLYLLRQASWYRVSAITQIIGDIIFASALCYFTGKDGSVFTIFFAFAIIIASILFSRAGAYIIATISSVIILIFAVDRQFLFLPYISGMVVDNTKPPLDQMVYSVFIHVLAYFVIAQLSSFLSVELKTTSERYYEQKRDYDILYEQYKTIVENLSDGVVLFKNGKLMYMNDVAADIFEINKATQNDYEIGEKMRDTLQRLSISSGGEISSFATGSNKIISVKHRRKTYGKDDIEDIYIISDLTESRRMQDEIVRSEKLASIGKVATGFAHEIRNPLSSILGSIELIMRTTKFENENNTLMNIIVKELLRVNELIERFLMFARPMPPKFTSVNLKQIVSEVVEMIKFDKDYREGIRIEIEDELMTDIMADPSMMKQVFWNLLKNSVQAIKEDGEIMITIKKGKDDGFAEIEVKDTGCGIPQTELNKIFDPFYSTKEKSIGIGLSIIHSIIKEHKGRIDVDSVVNEGTTFRIMLPIEHAEG